MRVLCLAGLPRLQSFASVLLCQGSCLADRSHTPSTYPVGTMAVQTATVSRHCQQGFLGLPILLGLPRYFKRAHSVPVGRAVDRWTQPVAFKLRGAVLSPKSKSSYRPVTSVQACRQISVMSPFHAPEESTKRIAFSRRITRGRRCFCAGGEQGAGSRQKYGEAETSFAV